MQSIAPLLLKSGAIEAKGIALVPGYRSTTTLSNHCSVIQCLFRAFETNDAGGCFL